MNALRITRPDDWHLHLRDGALLRLVAPHSAAQFARALIMPNLRPPVCDVARALAYRREILAALPEDTAFNPLMTLYLTAATSRDEVARAADSPHVVGFKLYPAGATTNAEAGVGDISQVMPVLEAIAAHDLVLQIHGEVTDPRVDVFDREAVFVERVLSKLHRDLPELRIVLEHVTTCEAVDFVADAGARVAATITPQHLLFDRNAMFAGGIRPHYYCLPPLKRTRHQNAVVAAATGDSGKFFLGTDSAPHTRASKESDCGCAGCYTAFGALEMYAEVFERAGALDKLNAFASKYGADFYRVPQNRGEVTLVKRDWQAPAEFSSDDAALTPLLAGETLSWRLE